MRDFCRAAAAPTLTPKRSWRLYVALDAERELVQPGLVGDPQRARQQPLRPLELSEPRPADPGFEHVVHENVGRHALPAGVAPLAPALEPDAIPAERCAMHQLDRGVV